MEYKEDGSKSTKLLKESEVYGKIHLKIDEETDFDNYNELISKINSVFIRKDGNIIGVSLNNQEYIQEIVQNIVSLLKKDKNILDSIDFNYSSLYTFLHILLDVINQLIPINGVIVVNSCLLLINYQKEQLNEFLPQLLGVAKSSGNEVLDSCIFIFSQLLNNSADLSTIIPEIVNIIHMELTDYFMSLIANEEDIKLTNSLFMYFTALLEICNKDKSIEIPEEALEILCGKGMDFIVSDDEETSYNALKMCVFLGNTPQLLNIMIESGIVDKICSVLFNKTNQIHSIPASKLVMLITNYEMVTSKDGKYSFLYNESFPELIINYLVDGNKFVNHNFISFVNFTLPQCWDFYNENHIMERLVSQLPAMSITSKKKIINLILTFLNVAPRSAALEFISPELIDEFENYIDTSCPRLAENICDTLIGVMQFEVLQYLRESSFIDTLQDFIDNSDDNECAEELMMLITGEYEEDEEESL